MKRVYTWHPTARLSFDLKGGGLFSLQNRQARGNNSVESFTKGDTKLRRASPKLFIQRIYDVNRSSHINILFLEIMCVNVRIPIGLTS